MVKYNITEKKEKKAVYRRFMSPEVKDELQEKIQMKLIFEQKYKDPEYSARKLASDLGTNVRYISAVCADRFNMNYCEFVNSYRINEAMSILTDPRYLELTMEEVCKMTGFNNRQSFYSAFFKFQGVTPREYKMNFLAHHPEMDKRKQKKQDRKSA